MYRFATLVLVTAIAACGGSSTSPAPAPPAVRSQPATTVRADVDSAFDDCVAVFGRQRTCSADYVPALVDLRVRLDLPVGIAATDRAQGRAALVAGAHAEWAADSTDDAIAAACRGLIDGLAPDALDALRDGVGRCLAASDCPTFVACIIPVTEAAMTGRL